jgi:hypothetical protein
MPDLLSFAKAIQRDKTFGLFRTTGHVGLTGKCGGNLFELAGLSCFSWKMSM